MCQSHVFFCPSFFFTSLHSCLFFCTFISVYNKALVWQSWIQLSHVYIDKKNNFGSISIVHLKMLGYVRHILQVSLSQCYYESSCQPLIASAVPRISYHSFFSTFYCYCLSLWFCKDIPTVRSCMSSRLSIFYNSVKKLRSSHRSKSHHIDPTLVYNFSKSLCHFGRPMSPPCLSCPFVSSFQFVQTRPLYLKILAHLDRNHSLMHVDFRGILRLLKAVLWLAIRTNMCNPVIVLPSCYLSQSGE